MGKILFFNSQADLDEKVLVFSLISQTIDLMHCTKTIQAIRKLVQVHDILELNYEIVQKYTKNQGPVWDLGSINDLEYIGRELFIYHRSDFDPNYKFLYYREELGTLVHKIKVGDIAED